MISDYNVLELDTYLNNIKIIIAGNTIPFFDYELKNAKLLHSILAGDKSRNLIIHPGGDIIFILYTVISSVVQYLKDMDETTNNILGLLQDGQIVEIDGYKAHYEGVDKYIDKDKNHIKLKYKDGIQYLALEEAYRLTQYRGSASKINKMPIKHSSKKSKTKEIISKLFDISKTELPGIVRNSSIIVAQKEKIYELMKSLSIQIDAETYEFTKVFPCSYYGSAENEHCFAGNYAKKEPIIKFTSKVAVARDLVQSDKNIKNICIDGEGLFENNLQDIDWIIGRNSIHNTTVICEWSRINTLKYFLDRSEDISFYCWDEETLISNIRNLFTIDSRTDDIGLWNKLIAVYLDKSIEVEEIKCDASLINLFVETRNKLNSIIDTKCSNEYTDDFFRKSYGLLNLFEKCCFTIQHYEHMINSNKINALHPEKTISEIKHLIDILLTSYWPENYSNTVNRIVSNLVELRELFLYSNPKLDELCKIINENYFEPNRIILPKAYYLNVLEDCFSESTTVNKNRVIPLRKNIYNQLLNDVLIVGLNDSKYIDIFNCCYYKKIELLLYPMENKLFKWKQKINSTLLQKLKERNLLTDTYEDCTDDVEIVEDYESIETEASEIMKMEEFLFDLIKRQTYFEARDGSTNSSVDKVECIRLVIFETGEKAYLTKYYKPSVVDYDNENILDKKVEELVAGDELVFVRSEINGDKDIIEDIENKLLQNEDFKLQYDQFIYMSNEWKHILKAFMIENNFNENRVSQELETLGIKRDPATVASWVRGNRIVGPIEKEVYYALAKVTNNEYLMKNWGIVCDACSDVRRLHKRIKKYLGKCIVNSIVKESNTEFEQMIKDTLGDLTEMAQIVQISYVLEQKYYVPFNMANRLIEE